MSSTLCPLSVTDPPFSERQNSHSRIIIITKNSTNESQHTPAHLAIKFQKNFIQRQVEKELFMKIIFPHCRPCIEACVCVLSYASLSHVDQ